MGTARNPITLGAEFGIDEKKLRKAGVLNATLAIDTRLFIDPLLLAKSRHAEIRAGAVAAYKQHFNLIIRLLQRSKGEDHAGWKSAKRLLSMEEFKGTCLGYGAGSIRGRNASGAVVQKMIKAAKEIVDIGVNDPDLFHAMALFEDEIGPDLISDMTTRAIIEPLAAFNKRVLRELGLKGQRFKVDGKTHVLLRNPYELKRTPIILVPTDVLRELPVAQDWDGVQEAARKNQELRDRVNKHVAEMWKAKAKRDKGKLKDQALATREAFETLLDTLRSARGRPYDLTEDPEGLTRWAVKAQRFAVKYPLKLKAQQPKNAEEVLIVVKEIIQQFRHLIEKRGFNKELYRSNGKPRPEATAQKMFFCAAYFYCKANDVDLNPEMDTGTGRIDFKFSRGFNTRVLVEIKLSTNANVIAGYTKQLEAYKKAEETAGAIYLVLDVGRMGKKDKQLLQLKNEAAEQGDPLSDVELVDGTRRPSASKLR